MQGATEENIRDVKNRLYGELLSTSDPGDAVAELRRRLHDARLRDKEMADWARDFGPMLLLALDYRHSLSVSGGAR